MVAEPAQIDVTGQPPALRLIVAQLVEPMVREDLLVGGHHGDAQVVVTFQVAHLGHQLQNLFQCLLVVLEESSNLLLLGLGRK